MTVDVNHPNFGRTNQRVGPDRRLTRGGRSEIPTNATPPFYRGIGFADAP